MWNSFVGDRRFDLTSFQKNDTPHNAAAVEWFQKVENSGWTIPISFDETGALGTGARDLTREIVWSVYTGGANFEMLTQPIINFADFGRHFEDMTRARGVVESLPFHQMRPSNSLLTSGKGYVFAQAGQAYLVYLPDGGNLNLNLSASSNSFSAQWFNPRDGSTRAIAPVAGGGGRSFSAPDGNDWALMLRRSSGGGNVAPTVSSQSAETPVSTPRDLTLAYTDPDGPGPYSFTIDQPPANGTLTGTGANLQYTPAAGYTGPDSFRWQVNDGLADSAVVTFSLTVRVAGENVPPVAPDQQVTLAGDSTIYIQLAYSDPDGPGPSSITIVQPPANGTLTGTDNDRFYTPNPGFFGADGFTWQVNDGLIDSNIAAVTLTVGDATGPGNGELVVSQVSVLSGEGYQVVNGGLRSGANVYIDRSYTFAAIPANLQGAVYVQTANDDKEATPQEFLSFTVNQDVTVLVGYDSRASALPEWLVTWAHTGETLSSTDSPLGLYSRDFSAGAITLGANLAPGAAGGESNYTVVIVGQGNGGNQDPNAVPSADSQVIATEVDTPLDLTLTYTDPDGPGPFSFFIDRLPFYGALTGSGANLTYTPAPGYVGTDIFTFSVNDGRVTSAPATVGITVSPQGIFQGLQLSKSADFSTLDSDFSYGETVYIRAWSDQVDYNDIKKSEWNLEGVRGSLTNNGDTIYTGQVVIDESFQRLNQGASFSSQVEIKVEDQRRGRYHTRQPVTLSLP
jgi:hypothetical protein